MHHLKIQYKKFASSYDLANLIIASFYSKEFKPQNTKDAEGYSLRVLCDLSALASLGLGASLWGTTTLKGRIRGTLRHIRFTKIERLISFTTRFTLVIIATDN